jgi:CheY-like chemotaxis protein
MPEEPRPVLLVEDEADDVTFVQRALAKHNIGNRIVVIPTAAAAQQYLLAAAGTRRLPLVAIIDVYLPGTSGLQLLKWLPSQDPTLRTLPVIVLTVSSDRSHEQQALELQTAVFLRKPVTEEILPDALTALGLILTQRVSGPDSDTVIEPRAASLLGVPGRKRPSG